MNMDAGGDIRGGEASIVTTTTTTAAKSRTCCGMKRRNFFIALAVLAAVLVAAIVGGLVGGLRSNSGSDDSNDSSSPTSTSTGAVPRKTGPIDADERCMAASIVTDDDNQNSQVFYNDLNSTDIYYRRIHDDEGTDAYALDLDIEPNWGAPMAAAAGLSSSSIETRLYYVITSDNETQIAQAVLNCGSLDADDDEDGDDDDSSSTSGPCSVTSNSIISTNVTNGVHPDTRLAALRLSNDSMRIYFQAGGANIWVLHDDDDGTWTGSNLIGNVREGSSIAASAANATALHVFYVSNSTQRLRYIGYSDILGADNGMYTVLPAMLPIPKLPPYSLGRKNWYEAMNELQVTNPLQRKISTRALARDGQPALHSRLLMSPSSSPIASTTPTPQLAPLCPTSRTLPRPGASTTTTTGVNQTAASLPWRSRTRSASCTSKTAPSSCRRKMPPLGTRPRRWAARHDVSY